jgi:lipopolysaccharide export system permease protein
MRHLQDMNNTIEDYNHEHKLLRLPNPIKVFFRPGDDQVISVISNVLEETIDDLTNTRDKQILSYINRYPILSENAHTRPFRKKWLNIVTGLVLPVGLFFYLRMCRFRLRLHKDLSTIRQVNDLVIAHIDANYH